MCGNATNASAPPSPGGNDGAGWVVSEGSALGREALTEQTSDPCLADPDDDLVVGRCSLCRHRRGNGRSYARCGRFTRPLVEEGCTMQAPPERMRRIVRRRADIGGTHVRAE